MIARAGTVVGCAVGFYVFAVLLHGHLALDASSAASFLKSLFFDLLWSLLMMFIAVAAGALAAAPFGLIAGRRTRPARRALERRLGLAADHVYEEEARGRIAGGAGPEQIVLFSKRGLPHG